MLYAVQTTRDAIIATPTASVGWWYRRCQARLALALAAAAVVEAVEAVAHLHLPVTMATTQCPLIALE